MCISSLKKMDEWRYTAFYMQTGRECAKKKEEEEGEGWTELSRFVIHETV